MIIKSLLALDRDRGTVNLAAAVRHTGYGDTIGCQDIVRLLVWHCPERESYHRICVTLLPLCERLQVVGLRVVAITPNVFALGLYQRGMSGSDNPARIVLLEVASAGELLGAELWRPGASRLSLIFDDHKDDVHGAGWLEAVEAMWQHTSMIELLGIRLPLEENQAVQRTPFKPAKQPRPAAPNPPPSERPRPPGSRRERARLQQQIQANQGE